MKRQDDEDARGREKQDPGSEVDQTATAVVGAAIEVHRILGPGFSESVYERAMARELERRTIPFARQVPIRVSYKDAVVGGARLDLLVDSKLVVELKAVECTSPLHVAQALSYLRLTKLPLALIINFNVLVLLRGVRRVVLSRS